MLDSTRPSYLSTRTTPARRRMRPVRASLTDHFHAIYKNPPKCARQPLHLLLSPRVFQPPILLFQQESFKCDKMRQNETKPHPPPPPVPRHLHPAIFTFPRDTKTQGALMTPQEVLKLCKDRKVQFV